jgi:hypothetical protein
MSINTEDMKMWIKGMNFPLETEQSLSMKWLAYLESYLAQFRVSLEDILSTWQHMTGRSTPSLLRHFCHFLELKMALKANRFNDTIVIPENHATHEFSNSTLNKMF